MTPPPVISICAARIGGSKLSLLRVYPLSGLHLGPLGLHLRKIYSILILRIDILRQRLPVMMFLAEALPVASIPKQFVIPTMRNDVVNHRCLTVYTLAHAHDAQRIRSEVFFPCLLPCPAVSSAAGRPYRFRMEALVFLTVLDPVRHKCRASG